MRRLLGLATVGLALLAALAWQRSREAEPSTDSSNASSMEPFVPSVGGQEPVGWVFGRLISGSSPDEREWRCSTSLCRAHFDNKRESTMIASTPATPTNSFRVDHRGNALAGVCVVIPARNEAASLPSVLGDLPDVGRVVVVDNGSTDGTAAVAEDFGALVVREERRGYGSACLAGLARLEGWSDESAFTPKVVVFLDGDYSDHPDLLPLLVEPILSGRADFVLGSRLLGQREPGAMPPQSVYGNRLACFLMRLLWGVRYTDLGPFRAIRYDALRRLNMEDRNFGWTVEMQVKAAIAGLRTLEVPVPYRRRIGVSKISGTLSGTVKAGTKILYTILKYGWKTRRTLRPHAQREERR